MTNAPDVQLRVQTDDGMVIAHISRAALIKLAGRSHISAEEIMAAHRIELEDIVRDKLLGSSASSVRIDERDL
jgi:hypothetical protein